jgi:hypothetical protein
MATQIQLRRDTAANWTSTNPTMAQGEAGYETDTGKLKVGDGTTAWNSLVYQAAANIVDGTIVNADVNASAAIAGTKVAPDFGSQTIATTGVFSHALGAVGTPSITFTGDLNTGIWSPAADTIAFSEGGVEAMRIDSSARVGIGTTSPIAATHIMLSDVTGFSSPANDGLVVERGGGNDLGITIATNNDRNGYLLFADSDSSNPAWVGYDHSVNAMSFKVNASERARIDSSGRLLVGTSTSIGSGDQIQAHNTSGDNIAAGRFSANAGSADISFYKSRSGTVGTNTVVNAQDSLGWLQWRGADGTGYIRAAGIEAFVDGTPGTNDMPGRLVFSTTADGASSPTERLRISSDGSMSAVIPGGSTLYPAFTCRAWVNFDGTGTPAIRASGNVSSITDNGTGDYTVNFTTALVDANFTIAGSGSVSEDGILLSDTRATTSAKIRFYNNGASSGRDNSVVSVAIFR